MAKRRILLLAVAVLCVGLTVFLSVSAVSVYREGALRREQDPLAGIYTPEIVAEKLGAAVPAFAALLILLVVSLALGVKDECDGRPMKSLEFSHGMNAAREARCLSSRARNRKILTARLVLLVLAVGLVILGILNGSAFDVFSKAVMVCTECVGLG